MLSPPFDGELNTGNAEIQLRRLPSVDGVSMRHRNEVSSNAMRRDATAATEMLRRHN